MNQTGTDPGPASPGSPRTAVVDPGVLDETAFDDEAALDDAVRCGACDHELTRPAWAIAVGGAHVATFRNPAGWSFRVACYRDAPGCGAHGELTDEASWFAGYAWSIATCGGCGRHVGWWYVGPDTFAGLITSRLR
jgi:hypothetical protein